MSPQLVTRPLMARPSVAALLVASGLPVAPTRARLRAATASRRFDAEIQRDFVDGMTGYAARDYRHAEDMFRRDSRSRPRLLRVRLELARTLFMEKKDEQADYQFRLAAAAHPAALVARNIVRFREAIRARRSWRFNFNIGLAPDSNINSATDKESVDIYGLPFQLDPGARARSGTGLFFGGDASLRLNRFGKVPIYLGAYGRWTRYRDHRFDDDYAGAEAGPELRLAGGRLRATATGLMRWYGKRPLVSSFGGHLDYDKLVGNKWNVGGSFLVRHNDYARRRDVDGWDAEVRASANRPLGLTTIGIAYARVERNWANDPGQAFWREALGVGILKEIGWGLRPQLTHRPRPPGERRQACSIREATARLAAARNCKHLQARLERGRLRAFAEPDRHSQLFDAVALPGTARSRRDPPDKGVLKPIS